jgi:hypothetical protein
MGWTKRDFIKTAFQEIGIPENSISPSQYVRGLTQLDSMMGEWHAEGIYLGYPISSSPSDSEVDTDTDVPVAYVGAVWSNLATRLGSGIGKVVMPETKLMARKGYQTLKSKVPIPERQLPKDLPIGSGNKPLAGYTNEYFIEGSDSPPDVDNQQVEGI